MATAIDVNLDMAVPNSAYSRTQTTSAEAMSRQGPGVSDLSAVCVNVTQAIAEELAHIQRARDAITSLSDARQPFGQRSGLALSGGGIRSASFAIGFLQALAERSQISRFDYMSAVSGGGYALGWWGALVARLSQQADADGACKIVRAAQEAERSIRALAEGQSSFELRHVRAHGNYLTLRTGLLSADTAAGFATILRNVVYGLCALGLPAVVVCWAALWIVNATYDLSQHTANMIGIAAALPLMLGWWQTCRGLDWEIPEADRRWQAGLPTIAMSMTIGAGLVGLFFSITGAKKDNNAALLVAITADGTLPAAILLVLGGIDLLLLAYWGTRAWPKRTTLKLLSLPWTLIGACLLSLWAGLAWLEWFQVPSVREAALGGPLPVRPHLVFLMLAMTHAWEWQMFSGSLPGTAVTARQGFWVKVVSFVLLLAVCLGLIWLAPYIVDGVLDLRPSLRKQPILGTAAFLGLLAFLGVLVNAVVAVGEGSQQAGGDHREWWARWSGQLFVASLYAWAACLASVMAHKTTVSWLWIVVASICVLILFAMSGLAAGRPGMRLISRVFGFLTLVGVAGLALLLAKKVQLFDLHEYGDIVIVAAIAVLSVLVLSVSGPNTFSMHDYYRNRLVRAFLGASNTTRKPHPPLGTTSEDDLHLKKLVVGMGEKATVIRPYPIWCAAVNATTDNHLGLSERKAASFVFTPLRVGLHVDTLERVPTGRRRPDCAMAPVSVHGTSQEVTKLFEAEPLNLGTAMATSAAAFSSNTGSSTTPERALVFALLGARLGRWFPNPSADHDPNDNTTSRDQPSVGWRAGLPVYIKKDGSIVKKIFQFAKLAPRSLFIAEAFSQCDLQSEAVYVTDGGHFENLGVYELIRRKVMLIVCVDATCDPEFKFADLFNLQTKVRTDFGAEIHVEGLEDLIFERCGRRAKVAFKRWTIVYARNERGDPPEVGEMYYCKSTITGTEPADLAEYHRRVPSFPHVSTVNQWFAESTFEAYRVLGLKVGREVAKVLSEL